MTKLILHELRPGPEYRNTAIYELSRNYTRRTLDIIAEGKTSGEFRSDVPDAVIRAMIYGGVEHYAFSYLRGVGDYSPDEAADAITDVIYRGLANEGINQANMLREPLRQIEDGLTRLKALTEETLPGPAPTLVRRVRASRK